MEGGARAKGDPASYPPSCRGHGKCSRRKVAAFGPPTIDHAQFEPDHTSPVNGNHAGGIRRCAWTWVTGYDCSDTKGHMAAASITPSQRRWRNLLMAAMAWQGLVNYSKEWWHFSLPGAGDPAYDFPIKPPRHN